MTLPESIRSARLRTGLSQKQVSKLTGIANEAISTIELGKNSNPTLRTLTKLADCYGCGLDELVGYESGKDDLTVPHTETFEQMMISAERYAFGRRTYMVSTTVDYLIPMFPCLSDWCLSILRNDMKSNAEMSQRTGNTTIYGDSCDYNDWMRFAAALNKEIDRRLADGKRHDFLR